MGLSLRTITEAYYIHVFPVIMEKHLALGRKKRKKSRFFLLDNALGPLQYCNHSQPMTSYSSESCLSLLASSLVSFGLKGISVTVKEASKQLPMIYIAWAFQRIPFFLFITKLLLLPSQFLSFSSNTFRFLTTFLQTT